MTVQGDDRDPFEDYGGVRLVNVSKVCPTCGRTQYMERLSAEVLCECGQRVTFTPAEKRHIVRVEILGRKAP